MKAEKKTCVDCLYCKVYKKSTESCRLCFCALAKKKANRIENYWLDKEPCVKFIDMTEEPLTVVMVPKEAVSHTTSTAALPRRPPLLRKKEFEYF